MTPCGFRVEAKSLLTLLVALLCLAGGLMLAWQHPLASTVALVFFYIWTMATAWHPSLWLLIVPAALPALNFWPWTGWLVFDEFDLLLLGTLAGGYARLTVDSFFPANRPVQPPQPMSSGLRALLLALVVTSVISLCLGLVFAGVFNAGIDRSMAAAQAQTYESVWNPLRIFKSLAFPLLLMPLLEAQMRSAPARRLAQHLLGSGMLVGLTIVVSVALWERLAYPGLMDFSSRYRTTALFWEMHVGGAAIDAYLAIATPFLAWALWATRRPAVWAALAMLAVLTCYAVLTTFSRGVYLAVFGPMILLAASGLIRRYRRGLRDVTAKLAVRAGRLSGFNEVGASSTFRWRGKAGPLLVLLLAAEVVGVLWGGTFLAERLAKSDEDLGSRIEHWTRGLSLLQTPMDWAFGKGLGRLPAEYARISTDTEFSGAVQLHAPPQNAVDSAVVPRQVTLMGPATNPDLGGQMSLTQRVDFSRQAAYVVNLKARAAVDTDVRLKVCEKHLIYEAGCHYRFFKLRPVEVGKWQQLTIPLRGRSSAASATSGGTLPRFGVFSISVVNEGGALALEKIELIGPSGHDLLENGDFSHGLARWFASAQGYYLPWHIDNVYIELLVERGAVGLILMGVLVIFVVKKLAYARAAGADRASAAGSEGARAASADGARSACSDGSADSASLQEDVLSRYVWASLVGAALIGLVSSWMDVPRIAFLVYLLLFFSIQMTRDTAHEPILK